MVVIRSATRHKEEALLGSEDSNLGNSAVDLLALELGARIFSSEDSRLIGRETSRQFARWFDSERRALALDWLDEVRVRVRGAVREHRRAARRDPSLSPAGEIKVLFQLFLFEMTSNLLYCLICLRGPSHVSNLAGSFLDGAKRMRMVTQAALPPVSVETAKN
jgi:hypothetical protein